MPFPGCYDEESPLSVPNWKVKAFVCAFCLCGYCGLDPGSLYSGQLTWRSHWEDRGGSRPCEHFRKKKNPNKKPNSSQISDRMKLVLYEAFQFYKWSHFWFKYSSGYFWFWTFTGTSLRNIFNYKALCSGFTENLSSRSRFCPGDDTGIGYCWTGFMSPISKQSSGKWSYKTSDLNEAVLTTRLMVPCTVNKQKNIQYGMYLLNNKK